MPTSQPHIRNPLLANHLATIGTVLVVTILAVSMLANGMMKPVSRDEHMYCTAGVLLNQGHLIYRDFAYPAQLPYHALLLSNLYRVFHTSHYLLVGRLVSIACDIAVVILILGVYRRAFGKHRLAGRWLGLAAAMLYAFNPLVGYASGYAWNHDVVIFCVVFAFSLFVRTGFRRAPRFWRLASIGALLTFATCMRITTAPVALLFLVVILLAARGSLRNRVRTALPFIIAGLLVSSWPLWIVMQAPRTVWLNLVQIPALYGRWLHELGAAYSKVTLTFDCLTTPGYLALLGVTAYLGIALVKRRSSLSGITKRNLCVAAGSAFLLFCVALVPPTMWHQYWAVPVPLVLVTCAYPMAVLRQAAEKPDGKRPFQVACGLTFACTAIAVVSTPTILRRSPAILVPERWAPVTLHKTAVDIATKTGTPKLVLTLGPLYALEGGCDIYRELASGSIIYRTAHAMSAEDRELTHTVGPETLDVLLRDSPPSAVILGVEPPYFSFLEDPLLQAVGPAWPRERYEDALQVYLRP